MLYTLSTSFLLPPDSIVQLRVSVLLYHLAINRTDSNFLQLDANYNRALTLTECADLMENSGFMDDSENDEATAASVRKLRDEARELLMDVFLGQEDYIKAMNEGDDHVAAADSAMDQERSDSEMEVDQSATEETEDDDKAYEVHVPTPSSLIDTALAFVDVQLTIWEVDGPTKAPTDEEQAVFGAFLEIASSLAPPGRQIEIFFAEAKCLLCLDRIVWDQRKMEAKVGSGVERSLEAAVTALEKLLVGLDGQPADQETVRADILVTLADTHSTIATRMLFLTPQLPPGPSPLAQQAWSNLTQAVTHLSSALNLPSNASTPNLFKPSVLLSLSNVSLARAKLWSTNETARRNAAQSMENASTYSSRAYEMLKWNAAVLPYPAGWDTESLARTIALQRLRVCFYGSKTDVVPEARERYAQSAVEMMNQLKDIQDKARRVNEADVKRWIDDIQDEGGIDDSEREWWKEVVAALKVS